MSVLDENDRAAGRVLTGAVSTGAASTGTVSAGTVFTPRQVQILKIAVIVMGILLVGGFAFVLAAIVYQASHPAQESGAASASLTGGADARPIDLPIPPGTAVTAMTLDGNRLALHLTGAAGPEILVIDLASGKIIAQLRLRPR